MAAVDLDLSGIGIRIEGLTSRLAGEVRREWGGFVETLDAEPLLSLSVGYLDRRFVSAPFRPKAMTSVLERSGARFEMPEGIAEVSGDGIARVSLVHGQGRREYWTMVNLLRACLAWRLPERGAALLHAAGLVVDGRAFLLVGPEGSGKSTWAGLGERGGARVLSDDLVLVDGVGPRLEALGAPFRSTHRAAYRRGRWPLAALLFPRHGAEAAWSAAPALIARGRLVANLPFIADALEADPRIAAVVDRLVGEVPCMDLTFGLDSSFVDLLRAGP